MLFDVETEKKQYCTKVKIDSKTYASDYEIDKRTRRVFRTFARVLTGRSLLREEVRQAEMSKLLHVVRHEVIQPILSTPELVLSSQARFDEWHRKVVSTLKTRCPITWDQGFNLTVGTAQKIVNLHCKDLWALNLVPSQHSMVFHPIIDRVTLGMLNKPGRLSWTKLDSYRDYMKLQLELRKMSEGRGTYPSALECCHWNRYGRPRR